MGWWLFLFSLLFFLLLFSMSKLELNSNFPDNFCFDPKTICHVHIGFEHVTPFLDFFDGHNNYGLFGKYKHWYIAISNGFTVLRIELEKNKDTKENFGKITRVNNLKGSCLGKHFIDFDNIRDYIGTLNILGRKYSFSYNNCQYFIILLMIKLEIPISKLPASLSPGDDLIKNHYAHKFELVETSEHIIIRCSKCNKTIIDWDFKKKKKKKKKKLKWNKKKKKKKKKKK